MGLQRGGVEKVIEEPLICRKQSRCFHFRARCDINGKRADLQTTHRLRQCDVKLEVALDRIGARTQLERYHRRQVRHSHDVVCGCVARADAATASR